METCAVIRHKECHQLVFYHCKSASFLSNGGTAIMISTDHSYMQLG